MRRLAGIVVALSLILGCGAKPGPPAAATKPVEGYGPPADHTTPSLDDSSDAGPFEPDAGVCCPVTFSLDVQADEVEGTLVISSSEARRVALDKTSGVWSGTTCMPLVDVDYYYVVGLPSEAADGGLFHRERANLAAPASVDPSTGLLRNHFLVGGAASCGALDAGVYADVWDAGS